MNPSRILLTRDTESVKPPVNKPFCQVPHFSSLSKGHTNIFFEFVFTNIYMLMQMSC